MQYINTDMLLKTKQHKTDRYNEYSIGQYQQNIQLEFKTNLIINKYTPKLK